MTGPAYISGDPHPNRTIAPQGSVTASPHVTVTDPLAPFPPVGRGRWMLVDPSDRAVIDDLADDWSVCPLEHRNYSTGDRPCARCMATVERILHRLAYRIPSGGAA